MAFIGTLRSKMGTWVVVFVFAAIALFILGDLVGGKSSMFDMNATTVGEIAGHTVSLEEFQQAVAEREYDYTLNFNRQPTDREMPTLREQAWELLILKYAIEPQYATVGVEVTSDEVVDMIQGKNVDENVKQAFTNPQTGEFDRARLTTYLKEIASPPPGANEQMQAMWQEQRTRWDAFQRNLLPGRERLKYENLIVKTNYVTTAEAELEYHNQTDVAEIKFLYIPFFADSSTAVTDSDLSDYYNKNKERFKTEDSRNLAYVSFPLNPSAGDSAKVKTEAEAIAAEFATTQEDSLFASTSTDGQNAFVKYTVASLPSFINPADIQEGKVIGPFIDGGAYKVFKISKISKDTVYNARARHILIKWADASDASKKEAKEKARNILKDIKGGKDFAAQAREFGTDGTASRGGDLGWFASGRMVKPFETAVFNATRTGLINEVVETDFGYHIIDVTELKTNTSYTIAVVERAITPGDETTNEIYRAAETFATDLSGYDDFKSKAEKAGILPVEAKGILTSSRNVGALGDSREIVRWLFNDASKGKVSTVFDLRDQYVIAIMTGGVEKGYRPLADVKDEIRPLAQNQVRGKNIIAKLGAATGTLDEMAAAFGTNASVLSSPDLKLISNSLPSAGFDPQAVGVAFSLENGKRSKPFIGESGVIVVELQNKTIAPAASDVSGYKTQLEQNVQSRTGMNITEVIKEKSDIEDERYKFY